MLILLATLFSMTAAAQKIDCSGTIVDTNGEPIIGASVFLKGETKGAVSDLNGVFKLQQVPEGSMITVSYIGYKTVETKAEADMRIVMHEDNELLSEVVVVGYGAEYVHNIIKNLRKVIAWRGFFLIFYVLSYSFIFLLEQGSPERSLFFFNPPLEIQSFRWIHSSCR